MSVHPRMRQQRHAAGQVLAEQQVSQQQRPGAHLLLGEQHVVRSDGTPARPCVRRGRPPRWAHLGVDGSRRGDVELGPRHVLGLGRQCEPVHGRRVRHRVEVRGLDAQRKLVGPFGVPGAPRDVDQARDGPVARDEELRADATLGGSRDDVTGDELPRLVAARPAGREVRDDGVDVGHHPSEAARPLQLTRRVHHPRSRRFVEDRGQSLQ